MQIVFVHVQKTAGTALFNSLCKHFDAETVFWGPIPPLSDPTKKIVGSHIPFRDHDFSDGRDRLIITSVRDPAERLISLYRYWRSMRWSLVARNSWPQIVAAKRLSFLDWLKDPEIGALIDNGLVEHFCDDKEASPEVRLQQAKDNVAKCDYIFSSHSLSDDMENFLDVLKLDGSPPDVVNTTEGNAEKHPESFEAADPIEITDEIFDAVMLRTHLDRELYDYVLSIRGEINDRIARKIEASPPQISLRRLDDGTSLLARGLRRSPAVLGGGWGSIEDWHVWSVQPKANLFFDTAVEVRSCEVKLQAHLPGGRETLRARIVVNNTVAMKVLFVGAAAAQMLEESDRDEPLLICSGTAPILINVPVDIGRGANGRVDIRFEIDNLLSPALLGLNEDIRELGVALYALRCSSDPAPGHERWKQISAQA